MHAVGLEWWFWHFHLKVFQSGNDNGQSLDQVWIIFPLFVTHLIVFFPARPLVIASLILISIGNGCIRACVTSLGGSQFELPGQSRGLEQYFSHYYFIYSFGVLLAKIIPPEIRAQTQCFGKDECYAAVFGVLATIFVIAWSELVFSLNFLAF